MNEVKFAEFKKAVGAFYEREGRKLPWRNTRDPYKILVSEVMLQQTQVSRVLEKYPTFIKRFPTITALAKAPLASVIREWSGLGYNRRAKFLLLAAQTLVREHGGKFPRTIDELCALPGVGKSTAGGILAFAFGIAEPFIETNIRRVFIHHFFPRRKNVSDSEILPLITKSLRNEDPRQWYYALFDYGTHLARVTANPNKKSAHYKKQSRFEGSHRQVRGKIIRALTLQKRTQEELLKLYTNRVEISRALDDLAREGFIRRRGAQITLV